MDAAKMLEMEWQQRKSALDCRKIFLLKDGNFYRAYEWSAWLLTTGVSEPIKVMRKTVKKLKTDYVCVGFPLNSVHKFTPDGATVASTGENGAVILLPDGDSWRVPQGVSEADFVNSVAERAKKWKAEVKTDELKPYAAKASPDGASRGGITGIVKDILSFPLESSTPLECASFLSSLKQSAASLL